MNKIKRPTLETTKNCIKILKEIYDVGGYWDIDDFARYNKERIAMVLTMLTDDKRYMKNE